MWHPHVLHRAVLFLSTVCKTSRRDAEIGFLCSLFVHRTREPFQTWSDCLSLLGNEAQADFIIQPLNPRISQRKAAPSACLQAAIMEMFLSCTYVRSVAKQMRAGAFYISDVLVLYIYLSVTLVFVQGGSLVNWSFIINTMMEPCYNRKETASGVFLCNSVELCSVSVFKKAKHFCQPFKFLMCCGYIILVSKMPVLLTKIVMLI